MAYLLANTNVALLDQDTSVVDRLGKTELVHTSLQTSLQEIFGLESQHVIELHAGLIQHTDTDETANKRIAFEETLGVLVVKSEELTGSTTDLGELEQDTVASISS